MTQNTPTEPVFASVLMDYLHGRARTLYEANKRRRSEITTPQEWQKEAARLHEVFLQALGGLPGRTPLKPRVTGTIDRGPYVIENVIIDSRPDFPVTCSIYLPQDLDTPAPGILIPCGHSANGRMSKAYQSVAIELALNGFVALGYDPVSQGERVQYYDEALGESRVGPCTVEHSQIDNQCALIGSNVAKYRIWDGMRCIDYLQSRPEVSKADIGCTGCSGGGTLTTYLTALDRRIQVSVPVCYVTTLEARQDSDMVADGEQNIAGQLADGLDHAEMLAMAAPCAIQIGAAEEDFFPIEGTREAADFCQEIYDLLDAGDRFDLFVGPGTHGYSEQIRHSAVEWFGRWFDTEVDHPDVGEYLLPDEELWCTQSGQVVTSMDCCRACDLTVEDYDAADVAHNTAIDPDDIAAHVLNVLEMDDAKALVSAEPLDAETLGVPHRDGVEHYRLFSDENLFSVLSVAGGNTEAITLQIDPDADHGSFAPDTPSALLSVCGTGPGDHTNRGERTYQEGSDATRRTLGREAFAAYFARIMGFPLLKLRVQDVLAAVEFVRDELGYESIAIDASGRAGIWALHAAVLRDGIDALTVRDCLWSYEEMMREPEYSLPHLADIPREVLLHYDLPQLCAALAPVPLTVVNPLDACGEPLEMSGGDDAEMIQKAYDARGGTFELP
ncbi:MAG: hypothetical protein ACLFWB_00615 [Armatimonadota bacterium]